MAYFLFVGCNIPARLPGYEAEAVAVLSALGVDCRPSARFACCGYPVRPADRFAWLVSAAFNMAVAEKAGRDMLVLCQCCFGSFKNASAALSADSELTGRANAILARQGLHFSGSSKIVNILTFLHDEIGPDAIKEKTAKPMPGIAAASHTGCHSLRPSRVTEFDDPLAPKILDDLISALGAQSVPYAKKLDCCGASLTGSDDSLSQKIMAEKLLSAKNAGAEVLVTACPWCQIQFETFGGPPDDSMGISAIPYLRLLGTGMGLIPDTLGLTGRAPAEPMPAADAAVPKNGGKARPKNDEIDQGESNA